jgi:hypothetical protein
MQHYTKKLEDECTAYTSQLSACYEQAESDASEVRSQLQSQCETFEKEYATYTTSAQQQLQSQALALQQTLSALVKDFLSTSTTILDKSAEMSRNQSSCIQQSSLQGLDKLLQQHQQSHAISTSYTSNLNGQLAAQLASIEKDHIGMQSLRTSAYNSSTAMTSTIGNKRKLVDEETSSMIANIDATSKKACQQIQHTSSIANEVLTTVDTASNEMKSTTAQALEDFTVYMNNEGVKLEKDIAGHFASTNGVYKQQQEDLQSTTNNVSDYHKDMVSTAVKQSGSTPRKVRNTVIPTFATTRSHALIKEEVRTNSSSNSSDLTHEEAMAILQTIIQSSSDSAPASYSSPSATVDDDSLVPSDEVESMKVQPVDKVISIVSVEEDAMDAENLPPTNITVSQRSSRRMKTSEKEKGNIPSINTRTRSNSNHNLKAIDA